MKRCRICGKTKPHSAFTLPKGARFHKRVSTCRACKVAKVTVWRKAHPEQVRVTAAASRKRTHNHMRYGLTVKQFQALAKARGGRCAICSGQQVARRTDGTRRNLCIDHDHRTGKVCDLLCSLCNVALGAAQDSVALLEKMITYLKRHA